MIFSVPIPLTSIHWFQGLDAGNYWDVRLQSGAVHFVIDSDCRVTFEKSAQTHSMLFRSIE